MNHVNFLEFMLVGEHSPTETATVSRRNRIPCRRSIVSQGCNTIIDIREQQTCANDLLDLFPRGSPYRVAALCPAIASLSLFFAVLAANPAKPT